MKPYYEQDGITIYHGDCREILPTLPKVDAAAVVTDPPYGVNFKYASHDDSPKHYQSFCREWFELIFAWSDGNVLMTPGATNVAMWGCIKPFKWIAAWHKPAAMGRSPFGFCNWEPVLLWGKASGGMTDVFRAMIRPDKQLEAHPCPKPTEWGIEMVLRAPNGVVLDPFAGSGTVLVAAKKLGRKAIGIEIEERYCEIAANRLAQGVLFGNGGND